MTGLVMAEVRKLWTLRTIWALSAIGVALVVLSTSSHVFSRALGPFTGSVDRTVGALSEVGNNSIIVLVVALLVMTTEFRHATVGRTLLVTPRRTQVLAAKLAVGALYAAAFFTVSLVVVAGLLLLRSVLEGVSLETGPEIVGVAWRGFAGLSLTGVLGVAVGALVRSQVVAVAGSLLWLAIVENLAAGLRPDVARWLPFQALNAVFLPADLAVEPGLVGPLAPGPALAVFLAYVVAATAGAGVLMRVRDV